MTPRPDAEKPSPSRLAAIAARLLLIVGSLVTVVVVWRWSIGATDRPLPAAALIFAGLAIAATTAAVRRLGNIAAGGKSTPLYRRAAVEVWISLLVILLAVVFSSHIASSLSVVAFWVIVCLGETMAWKRNLIEFWYRNKTAGRDNRSQSAGDDVDADLDGEEDISLAEDELQRIVRKRLTDGNEVIYGTIRVTIDAGRRLETVHLAFSPPLCRTPVSYDAEPIEGPDATIGWSRIETFGARLDIKLDQPAEIRSDLILLFSVATTADDG